MAILYPTSLDTLTNPNSSQYMDDPTVSATWIVSNLNDAVEALEAKVWINGSAETTSLDYKTSRLTAKGDILTHDWTNPIKQAVWTNGYMLVADSTQSTWIKWSPTTAGWTVTTASVVSANWFAWTVATATTTPAITLTTSVTWVLKGNWTAISAATAWTDYVTPTGSETLTNKTLTSPAITWWTATSQTITTPVVNVWSDANGDMYYRASWVLSRIPIWSTNNTLSIVAWVPTWWDPYTYTGTVINDSISVNWTWSSASTSRQVSNMSVANVALTRWTDWNTKLEYSPNNATWTDIVNLTTGGSVSFPILMKKWYYYRVNATSNIAWTANTASINYIQ